eukprot:2158583-Amphidinium_carterae.2
MLRTCVFGATSATYVVSNTKFNKWACRLPGNVVCTRTCGQFWSPQMSTTKFFSCWEERAFAGAAVNLEGKEAELENEEVEENGLRNHDDSVDAETEPEPE